MKTASVIPARLRPIAEGIKARNTIADWMFYDVRGLTRPEYEQLARETNLEGAILVVEPRPGPGAVRIQKFDGFERFRAEPGDLIRHFSIAGVGSSDVGAAALARTLANHLDAPVGAIVAGYGLADIAAESLGGWLFFGPVNRSLHLAARAAQAVIGAADLLAAPGDDTASHRAPGHHAPGHHAPGHQYGPGVAGRLLSPDTRTLVRLLCEPERRVETLLGHSKGCLSLAYALEALHHHPDPDHYARAQDVDVVTTGAVVAFPDPLPGLRQYLGGIDWFGGMNSRLKLPHTVVPSAWHHLNTAIPAHMDLAAVLAGAYD
jgi:hypothetical protein